MPLQIYKYQALGNHMIVIDPATFDLALTGVAVRLLCNPHLGLGADGICYGPLADAEHRNKVRFFNPDGSEAEKSGNGLRIFARYLRDAGYESSRNFELWMNGTIVQVTILDEAARTLAMEIGQLSFFSRDIPVRGSPRAVVEELMTFNETDFFVTAATIGNPHCVIFADDVSAKVTQQLGPIIEDDFRFPNRTNIQFAHLIDRHTIRIEIWERGAGYTLASGTSASAAAGAAIKTGRCDSPVEVRMPGGSALVDIDREWQVKLTGGVEAVYRGTLAGDMIDRLSGF